MPRIWAETVDTHRRLVQDAIVDATAELAAEHGPLSVSMSAIAERAGVGRATLYKYFPDVESIFVEWHRREFSERLEQLKALSTRDDVTLRELAGLVRRGRIDHRGRKGAAAGILAHTAVAAESVVLGTIEAELVALVAEVVRRLARGNQVRTDHSPKVLARWILHGAHASPELDDRAVVDLLVDSLAPRPPSSTT